MYIEQWEYAEEIERIAREALKEERDYGQSAHDIAWEIVDGHRWIIYTSDAVQIPALAYSDGENFLDSQDLNATYRKEGLGGLHSMIAFACMLDDVQAKIEELRGEVEDDTE